MLSIWASVGTRLGNMSSIKLWLLHGHFYDMLKSVYVLAVSNAVQ